MKDETYLEKLIINEIEGKKTALHAYDKMMWAVRTGLLTLIFGGWGFIIKTAIENKIEFSQIKSYAFVLSGLSLSISCGAIYIDYNYAKRKFRVITSIDELVELAITVKPDKIENETKFKLISLLKISGDTINNSYKTKPFWNEIKVISIIYTVPVLPVCALVIYYLIFL